MVMKGQGTGQPQHNAVGRGMYWDRTLSCIMRAAVFELVGEIAEEDMLEGGERGGWEGGGDHKYLRCMKRNSKMKKLEKEGKILPVDKLG